MSVEAQLFGVLKVLCPRTFPDFAPVSTVRPYVTWQQVGGVPLRYLDNTAATVRNAEIQINVWADTRLSAVTLARQIEDALCASDAFQATPNGELVGDFDADIPVYGTRQDFAIHADR